MLPNPLPTYRIRYAVPDDADAVIGLRRHAETWLRAAGIEQWTVSATGDERIKEHLASGTTYIVTTGAGDTIGSLSIDAADLDFWTHAEASQPALYLYKFMLASHHRGRGLGDLLLDWSCQRAAKFGAKWLRLDCWKTNTALHRYYLDRGFSHLDTRTASGRESGALFERPVTTLLVNTPRVRLIDDTLPRLTSDGTRALPPYDRYDPEGEAAVYYRCAEEIAAMISEDHPGRGEDLDYWAAALEAAARRLDNHGRKIRQANGMYNRVMDGCV